MTYLPKTPSTQTAANTSANAEAPNAPSHSVLPGLPCGPDVINTLALRAMIPVLIARLFAMFSPQRIERGARARLWEVRRLFVSLYKAEKFNMKQWLLKALRENRMWRHQVLFDLGGEDALIRWEKRYAKWRAGETASPRQATGLNHYSEDAARQTQKKPGKVRTDRYELFCLARVSRAIPAPAPAYVPPLSPPVRLACISILWPQPIPLTPDHLRGPEGAYDDTESYQGGGVPQTEPSSNAPALTRDEITKCWDKVFYVYSLCNLNLMNLYLAINDMPQRWEPIPI